MSTTSVSSSTKREKETVQVVQLQQELDSIKSLNSSLQTYLDHIRTFKKNLINMNDNYKQLHKINTQWVETMNMMK